MPSKHPLFRHSPHMEEALFLIREQLKSRRFFNALRSIGMDDSSGEVHLEPLILYTLDLDDGSDEIMNYILSVLDKHAQHFKDDDEQLDKSALEVYCALLERWRGRKGTGQ